ncbi:MAG: TIGR04141 family sporadically distributed protein, partial [Actinomycetota bacterium]
MLCLDKKLVPVRGYRSGIELCDLLSTSGHIVHVKPRHSSST